MFNAPLIDSASHANHFTLFRVDQHSLNFRFRDIAPRHFLQRVSGKTETYNGGQWYELILQYFFPFELRLIQLAIQPSHREQLLMCAALDDLSAIHHQN